MLYKWNTVIDQIKIHITLIALNSFEKTSSTIHTGLISGLLCPIPTEINNSFWKEMKLELGMVFSVPCSIFECIFAVQWFGDKVMLLRHPSKSVIFRIPAVKASVSVNKIVSEHFGKENCCWLKLFKQETWSCVREFGCTPGILKGHEGERPGKCCTWCWMAAVALFLKIVQVYVWRPIFFPKELEIELYNYTWELFAVLDFHS